MRKLPKNAIKTQFKKGNSGNPNGRPPESAAFREIKKLSRGELEELSSLLVKGDINALRDIVKNETASALQVMVASVVIKIIKKGDMSALDKLLDRLVGKVTQHQHFTGDGTVAGPTVVLNIPSNGREVKKS